MADGRQSEDYLQALAIYDSIFPRYQSAEPQIRRVEEFPGLEAERRSFASDHGQTHGFDKTVGYELDQKLFADVAAFFNTVCCRSGR